LTKLDRNRHKRRKIEYTPPPADDDQDRLITRLSVKYPNATADEIVAEINPINRIERPKGTRARTSAGETNCAQA